MGFWSGRVGGVGGRWGGGKEKLDVRSRVYIQSCTDDDGWGKGGTARDQKNLSPSERETDVKGMGGFVEERTLSKQAYVRTCWLVGSIKEGCGGMN